MNERECSLKLPLGQVFVACDLEVVVQGVVDRLVVNRAILCAGFHSLANLVLLFTGKRVRCRGHFIMAVLADGGKNFGRNPTLEALGRFELGAEDQSVEARLVDAVDQLTATVRFDFGLEEVFWVDSVIDSANKVLITERFCNVVGNEKGKLGRTECADLNILERENRWCCHFRLLRFNVEPCNPTPIGWAGVAGWRTALRKRPPEGACKPSRKESCKGGTDLVLPFSGGRVTSGG